MKTRKEVDWFAAESRLGKSNACIKGPSGKSTFISDSLIENRDMWAVPVYSFVFYSPSIDLAAMKQLHQVRINDFIALGTKLEQIREANRSAAEKPGCLHQ